jgi:hypothetical protein
MEKLAALYNHWCIADSVRIAVEAHVEEKPAEARFLKGMSPAFAELALKASKFNRIMVWYALLYVVVEGYRELNISYPPLNEVLAEGEYDSLLRRFRNATFHYQENPFSAKLVDFLEKPESESWIQGLNRQLEAFFLDTLPIKETIDAMERGDA